MDLGKDSSFLLFLAFFLTSIRNMSTFKDTPAIFNFNAYSDNDSLSYVGSYGPFIEYGGPLVDPTRDSLDLLVGSDGTTHAQQFQEGFSTPMIGARHTDAYRKQGFENHR